MLQFRDIKLEDKKIFDRCSKQMGEGSCDFTFANVFCWGHLHHSQIAEWGGFVFIRFIFPDEQQYTYMEPIGEGDAIPAFEQIVEYVSSQKQQMKMAGLSSNFAEKLRLSVPFCNYYIFPCREQFDYIYNSELLASLRGKSLQPKRNHINTFKKLYNYTFKPLSASDKGEVLALLDEWQEGKEEVSDDYLNERRAIECGMDNFEALGLRGMALYIEGKMVAFTYGSAINRHTFCVHIEKGSPRYEQSFAMINNLFATSLAEEFTYINREEDLGIEGLRRAKMSYQPIMLYPKFSLIEIAGNEEVIERIKHSIEGVEISMLWREAFGDDEEFIDKYISVIRPVGKSYILRDRDVLVTSADIFAFKGEFSVCPYVYGVATKKDYRGRGYAKLILKDIFECIYRNGANRCMLIAAENQLAEWYISLGFSRKSIHSVTLNNNFDFDFGTGYSEQNLLQYRVINAESYLQEFALLNPDMQFCVTVEDAILQSNCATFKVGAGEVCRCGERCDNVVSISQLFDLYPLREESYSLVPIGKQ